MSVGLGLFRKLISESESFIYLSDNRISQQHFSGNEIPIYQFLNRHYLQYGVCPELATVEQETGITFPPLPSEALPYWVDKVRDRRIVTMLISGSKRIAEAANSGNISNALDQFKSLASEINNQDLETTVQTLNNVLDPILAKFDQRQTSSSILGVPFGFPYIDEITDGAQGGDTIALAGKYASGKTYLLLSFAINAWRAGKTPLIFTAEMPIQQCAARVVALYKNIPHTKMRLGKLSYWGRQKLVRGIAEIKARGGALFYFMQGGMYSTVEDLMLRVQDLKPSVLYVDGAYMLKTRSRSQKLWERVGETSESLKHLATAFKLPVIASYQLNAQSEIGHSGMAIKQLASIVMVLNNISNEKEGKMPRLSDLEYKSLEFIKGREGESGKISMLFDMVRMIIKQENVIRE